MQTECINHRENLGFIMYNESGETTDAEQAYLVILESENGAKNFIDLCKENRSRYAGIDEYSYGIFVWECDKYIEICLRNFKAISCYFNDRK